MFPGADCPGCGQPLTVCDAWPAGADVRCAGCGGEWRYVYREATGWLRAIDLRRWRSYSALEPGGVMVQLELFDE